ncbi:MAG: Rpn family recombination-promoting nuclease/putative transposase [Cyanobacteria bacterium RM1_2_2]|nr:Rpn family recombination-promoting nuclease/putative transposase [Cyanobacteria bacterium RM1_2_2]
MRRDAIFYQLFKHSPSLLFELVAPTPPGARNYRFESVEVKEPSFRIDGVFLPPKDASPRVIFFAEVQFQKDNLLYHRFFAESLLYLYRNPSHYDDWAGVLLFASRNLEPADQTTHRSLLNSPQIQRIYLDELGSDSAEPQPLGIQLMQLTLAPEQEMVEQARRLLEQAESQTGNLSRQEIIEVITTIVVYKFSNLSRVEVEAMLGVNLEETRVYREAKEEGRQEGERLGKLQLVPLLQDMGMTVEQIAERTGLSLESIRQALQNATQNAAQNE